MSKNIKTSKNTSENYKKQILFFQKCTEPKISYNISWDFSPHFVVDVDLFNLIEALVNEIVDIGFYFKVDSVSPSGLFNTALTT